MPESATPESHCLLKRGIGVVLSLGVVAAGNLEFRKPPQGHMSSVRTFNAASVGNCVLETPVTLLCPVPTAEPVTTLAPKPPPVTTATTTTTLAPQLSKNEIAITEASKGLQGAAAAEVRYLGCISLKESNNKTSAFNPAGPYYGKYQFHRITWDGFVDDIDLDVLVGVEIREVEEPVQDYVALQFLRHGRNGEWGPNRLCKHFLTSV